MNEKPKTCESVPVAVSAVGGGYRLLDPAREYPLKSPCPYCGGKLVLSGINGAEEADDGTWVATNLDINCMTEPDIDGPEWEGWWQDHSAHDFCQGWHDLHERVVASLKRTHRVSHDNKADSTTCAKL